MSSLIDITDQLDHNQVYTFVGKFDYDHNRFETIDGNIIQCYAYRHHSRYMKNHLVAVNLNYTLGFVNAWVIFQAVILDEEEVTKTYQK